MFTQDSRKPLEGDGLGLEGIHARVQAVLAVPVGSICRHCDDGQLVEWSADVPYQPCCRDPVEIRHLHVHQHEIESGVLHMFDRLPAVAGNDDFLTQSLQQLRCNTLVYDVVLHEQDTQTGINAVGVEPLSKPVRFAAGACAS